MRNEEELEEIAGTGNGAGADTSGLCDSRFQVLAQESTEAETEVLEEQESAEEEQKEDEASDVVEEPEIADVVEEPEIADVGGRARNRRRIGSNRGDC